MQAKSKLILALSFVSIILTCIAVSMVITFASVSQTVESLVRINYVSATSQDVMLDASANKYFKTDNPIAFTGGTNGVVTFDANSSDNQSLTTQTTELSITHQYVIYEYVFTNNGTNTINISMNVNNLNNLIMFYTTPSTTRKTNIYTSFDESDYTQGTSIPASNIASGATVYAYVAIKIDFLAGDASYTHGFDWTIIDGAAA